MEANQFQTEEVLFLLLFVEEVDDKFHEYKNMNMKLLCINYEENYWL